MRVADMQSAEALREAARRTERVKDDVRRMRRYNQGFGPWLWEPRFDRPVMFAEARLVNLWSLLASEGAP